MIIFFFLLSLVILLSITGYGLLMLKVINHKDLNYNYGLAGILGLFFLSIFSSYSHIILSHNFLFNIIIILIGFFLLLFFSKLNLKETKYLTIIFSLLFIAFIISKTNEDYAYYHLPNALQFAQQKLQFGLGNINHGFKHISSLFMLMSLNYLPFVEHYFFNLTNFCFLVFFVYFIYKEIYYRSKNNHNISLILLALFLILILVKFSRIAEYGADIAGQIIIAIYVFYNFELIFNNKLSYQNKILYIKISLFLLIFAISTKFILVIYSLIVFLSLFYLKEKKKLILSIFNLKYFIFLILPVCFLFFFNFVSTGCIIYPVSYSCFSDNFEWALPMQTVNDLKIHYEIWSKGGKGPTFEVLQPEEYIRSFNWLSNWISVYFFNKFLDYLVLILFIILVLYCFFYKQIIKRKKEKIFTNKFFTVLISLIIIFIVWFMNFPTLRYAGYLIVFLVVSYPFISFLNNKVNLKDTSQIKKITIIFLISYFIFFIKNTNRIYNELNIPINEHHNFKNFPFYWVDHVNYDEIEIYNHKVYKVNGKCWDTPSTCVRNTNRLKIYKKKGYIYYSIIK